MVKIVDLGARFGFGVAEEIFAPWNATIVVPDRLEAALKAIKEADLVCFGGGEDIHPSLYGHENIATSCGRNVSWRDNFEVAVWKFCQRNKIPVLGICRGAQMVCAMSGGFLIQDTEGHGASHTLITKNKGEEIEMTSTHHQMMFPFKVEHELIAWTTGLSPYYTYDARKESDITLKQEPEIVFFPKTRALSIQGHPEYYHASHPSSEYVRNLVKTYLLESVDV